jgi:alpha-glucosidase (family GH31 glycosyl hydrolase)
VNPESFPGGIRGFSDELRKLGLRPGIWWSPTCQVDSDLYRDHPDWFLRREDGGVLLLGEKNAFLDYTHPEALEHLDRTLSVILGEWGMDACKMDFWSQNFECRQARLHDPTKTAVQARTAFFEVVRKNLPPDGVFMTCVAVGMGNPFIGRHADTYRNTIDIGVGDWHEQIYNCAWSLPTLLTEGRKTFLLNNDSVGANLKVTENENFFRFTWSFMHQGMIETGGRMEEWPAVYVEAMRRCTEHIDRGYPVRCADPQAFTGTPFPKVLVVDYPEGSATRKRGVRKHVALFNWEDVPQVIGASNAQLGLEGETAVRDFWTDEARTFVADGIYEVLPPHTARLYEIT